VYKKLLIAILVLSLLMTLTACTKENSEQKENGDTNFLTEPQEIVPIELEIVKNNQSQVDNGHSPWQLDPLQVTMTFVSLEIFPEGINGDFPLKMDDLKLIQNTGSLAIIEVKSGKTSIKKVYLKKLIKQDDSGIWTVVGYDDNNNGTQENSYNKDEIHEKLTANKDIFKANWSPDATMVVYIEGQNDNTGLDKAYLWQVGEESGEFVRDVSPTTHGFTWSPDSKYFLISEKLGEGVISSIVQAENLIEEEFKVKSVSTPVWSPDSLYLAFGIENHDTGENWSAIEVYKLGEEKTQYIWRTKNVLYKVDSWDIDGNIGYTEINSNGEHSKKTTKYIKPSIFGLHLGDHKDKVEEILGKEYKETYYDEAGHFPETFYIWEYDKGFIVIIGKSTNNVLEITTTSPDGETNLGIKVGDKSEEALKTYRAKYIEPESIHGGELLGVFKVESGQAIIIDFNVEDGLVNPEKIGSDAKVERIILTYPEYLDDSF